MTAKKKKSITMKPKQVQSTVTLPRQQTGPSALTITLAVILSVLVALILYGLLEWWSRSNGYESQRTVTTSEITAFDIAVIVGVLAVVLGGPIIAAIIVAVVLRKNKKR